MAQPLGDLAGFLIRCSALVLVLFAVSRFPAFRSLFYRRTLDARGRLWYVLFWSIASVLATRLTVVSAFVPFFAGLFGDVALGGSVGVVAAAWRLLTRGSIPGAAAHLAAGLVGGRIARRLRPGRRLPLYAALVAGLLSVLGMDAPDHPGLWLPLPLVSAPIGMAAYVTLAFTLTSFAFMRLMEFLLTEGERERARAADRVLALAGEAQRILARGLTPETAQRLAERVQDVLDVPACFVSLPPDHLAFAGEKPHAGLQDGPREGVTDHHAVFASCPLGCPYTAARLVPLQDGLRTVAVLGLLETRSSALPPSASETVQGLGTLLSGSLSEARVRQQKADLEAARFQFLQAQIQPHFLFNALNTVASLATREPAAARDVVVHLSHVLRESFRHDRPLIGLDQELETVRAYLAVEQARFGDRLRVAMELPDPLPACRIPPFTLQPLVENAVRHGIGPALDGGEVRLRVAADDRVRIEIEDTGAGMDPSRLDDVLGRRVAGIGVGNVRERLAAVFGDDAGFAMESQPGAGTRVILTLPMMAHEGG